MVTPPGPAIAPLSDRLLPLESIGAPPAATVMGAVVVKVPLAWRIPPSRLRPTASAAASMPGTVSMPPSRTLTLPAESRTRALLTVS
jgi:hypothetical protein